MWKYESAYALKRKETTRYENKHLKEQGNDLKELKPMVRVDQEKNV